MIPFMEPKEHKIVIGINYKPWLDGLNESNPFLGKINHHNHFHGKCLTKYHYCTFGSKGKQIPI